METIPEQPEFIGSDLTEEQRALMPEVSQVALAIESIEHEQRTTGGDVKEAGELTASIVEHTGLEADDVRSANRQLLQRGFLDRENFSDPSSNLALRLSLTDEGRKFLEEEIEKVKKT